MLDDAADEVQARFRQVGVAVAGEHRLAVLPDALVGVHAGAVVAVDRLRHERRRLAIAVGDVVDAVFVDLHLVGHLEQRAELGAELVLALGDLVVVLLDGQAHLAHAGQHLGPQVALAVNRRHGEVAALDAGPVAHVAFGVVLEVGAGAFDAVDGDAAGVGADAEADAVEDEELGFRAHHHGVADAAAFHVGLRLLRRAARVAGIGLPGARLEDVAEQDQARLGGEGVHDRRGRVGHQDHVALVDRLPAGDRAAVEHDAVAERVLVDGRDVLRRVLPLAARVGEPQVHVLHGVLAHHLHDVGDAAGGRISPCAGFGRIGLHCHPGSLSLCWQAARRGLGVRSFNQSARVREADASGKPGT